MRNTWLLIKNYFNSFLGNILKKKKEAFKYGTALMFLLLFGGLFIFMFTSMSISSTTEAIKIGMPIISLYLTASMSLMFVILMTITKSSTPTKGNDEELLLSLPLSKTSIVVSKVFFDYLFDLAIVLVTLLPAFIVYVNLVPGATFFIIIRGIVVIITLPMFSSALGYFLGLIFNLLSRKFKHYSIAQSILTIIFFVVFLAGYYALAFMSTSENMNAATTIMNLGPVKWIVNFSNSGDIVSLIYILICTVLPFIISILIKSLMLGKSINKFKSKNKVIKYEQKSPIYSLYKRELARYFSIPMYVVNTSFGSIIIIIIGAVLLSVGTDYIDVLLMSVGLNKVSNIYIIMVLLIIIFGLSTSSTTSSSISLEGKELWILKAHPINEMQMFNAKILLNMTVISVPSIIGILLISFAIGFSYFPFLLIITIISCYVIACIGIIINLLFPKLEWDNEMVPIKQGIAVLITMGVSLIALIIPVIVLLALSNIMYLYLLLTIVCVIYILIAIGCYIILKKVGPKLFKKIYN